MPDGSSQFFWRFFMNVVHIWQHVLRSVRFLVIAFICTLLFVSAALPASAYTTSKDQPLQDDEVLQKSAEVLRSGPASMKTVQERSSRGPNEVQADADLDKMSRPENSKSAVTIEERIEKALDKASPNTPSRQDR
jgi:hypothetical protein